MHIAVHLFSTRDRDTMDRIARVMWIIGAELNMEASLWYTADHSEMALAAKMPAETAMATITSLRQLLDIFGRRAGETGYCQAPAIHGSERFSCGAALNADETCPNGKRHKRPQCDNGCIKCKKINTGDRHDGFEHWA